MANINQDMIDMDDLSNLSIIDIDEDTPDVEALDDLISLEKALDKVRDIIADIQEAAADIFECGDIDFANGLDALAVGLSIKVEKRFKAKE